MARRAGRDVLVGTFATLALIVFAIAIMTVGGEGRLARGVSFKATFPATEGLRLGSPVKMAGVQVGSVRDIMLPTDPESEGIEVVLSVDRAYAARVREDSVAALRYLQVLSGEKYVVVTPGTPGRPELEEGARIALSGEREFFEQGADIAGNINEITVSLKTILGPLERGEGILGQMLHDPAFGKEGLEHLHTSLENLEQITTGLRKGQGVVGRLLQDRELARRVDDLARSLERVTGVLDAAARREGAIGAILDEGGAGEQAVESFRDVAESLKRTAQRLEAGEGVAGRLLNDPEYGERVAADLGSALTDLKEIMDKINSGHGTLGALVNDRSVYDGVDEVVSGTKDSKFAQWLLRHYRKKGIESQQKAEEQQKP